MKASYIIILDLDIYMLTGDLSLNLLVRDLSWKSYTRR